MLANLRNRNFALLWLGGLISLAGDWTLNIGMPIALYMITHSVTVLALSFLAYLVPQVILGSLAGVLVDRWNRRRTLIVSNVLLALMLTPLLLVTSAHLIWLVFATMFVEACLEQFTRPTESAFLPVLVEDERLASANGLIAVASNVARLGGPALGGVIAVTYGLTGVVVADGSSFLLAALLFALIRAPRQATPAAEAKAPLSLAQAFSHTLADWLSGLRVIWHERTLALIFVIFSVMSIGEGIMGTLFVVFITVNAHGDARAYGGMMSAQAVGGLLGGALVAVGGKRLLKRWVISLSAFLFGAIDLAIFNAPTYFPTLSHLFAPISWLANVSLIIWLLALFALVGIPGGPMSSGLQTLTQLHSPDGYLGRVFATLGACTALFLALGTGLAAWLTPRFGVIPVLNAQGSNFIIIAALLLIFLHRGATQAAQEPDASIEPAAEPVGIAD